MIVGEIVKKKSFPRIQGKVIAFLSANMVLSPVPWELSSEEGRRVRPPGVAAVSGLPAPG